jgi:hypothetical protein
MRETVAAGCGRLPAASGVAAVGCDDEGEFLPRREHFGVTHHANL